MIPSSGYPPWPPDHPRTLPRTSTPTPPPGARSAAAMAETTLVEMLDDSLVGQLVIGLENQQVVCPARQDPLGDCGLTAHGVQRHDAVLQRELVQQFRDGCDLVRRLMDPTLAQHEALLARPGAHQVQGGPLPPSIE